MANLNISQTVRTKNDWRCKKEVADPDQLFFPALSTTTSSLRYHNFVELTQQLGSLVDQYPDLLTLYSLSEKSVQGRELWVVRVSTDPTGQRSALKPMVKYVANMHGDEVVGRELMIHFIEYLVTSYIHQTVSSILEWENSKL